MGNTNPKLLNLDDLEIEESEVTVRHLNKDHKMRTLTVEAFIAQQKRAAEHQARAESGEVVSDEDIGAVVQLIRDSVVEFFPTLPVDEMETTKLFKIFAWLNELSAKINEVAADESAEGNVPKEEPAAI